MVRETNEQQGKQLTDAGQTERELRARVKELAAQVDHERAAHALASSELEVGQAWEVQRTWHRVASIECRWTSMRGIGGSEIAIQCSLLKQGDPVYRLPSSQPPLSWPASTCGEVELLLAEHP